VKVQAQESIASGTIQATEYAMIKPVLISRTFWLAVARLMQEPPPRGIAVAKLIARVPNALN
jgi:hypothetical protein